MSVILQVSERVIQWVSQQRSAVDPVPGFLHFSWRGISQQAAAGGRLPARNGLASDSLSACSKTLFR